MGLQGQRNAGAKAKHLGADSSQAAGPGSWAAPGLLPQASPLPRCPLASSSARIPAEQPGAVRREHGLAPEVRGPHQQEGSVVGAPAPGLSS